MGAHDLQANHRRVALTLAELGLIFEEAKVGGSLFLDFYGDSGEILNQGLRLRTASIDLEWKTRSLMAGLEKPIFNPREPNSLAQVGISPLTGAGNLWLWIPQVRFEQRIALAGEHSGLRAQFGVVGTREAVTYNVPAPPPYEISATRPGLEGRFELFHGRFEVAPGFHYSVSHVQHVSVPSRVFSLDWRAGLAETLDWSGALFKGSNVGHLGTGGLGRSFNVYGRYVSPIHSMGGWTQLSWRPFPRANFNFFTGQHDDRDRDLYYGRIAKNLAYGANLIYRLAPNVLLGLEAAQVRSRYIGQPTRRNNHYDLALAYLF